MEDTEAIAKGAEVLLLKLREREHILSAVLQAVDQYETLIATMRASETAETGRQRVGEWLSLDDVQADAVTGILPRMLTEQHHRRMVGEYDQAVTEIADLEAVLASPERLRELVGTERGDRLVKLGLTG